MIRALIGIAATTVCIIGWFTVAWFFIFNSLDRTLIFLVITFGCSFLVDQLHNKEK